MQSISKHYTDGQVLQANIEKITYIARRLTDNAVVLLRDINLQGIDSAGRSEIIAFYDGFSRLDTEYVVKVHRIWPQEDEDRLLIEIEYFQGEQLSTLLNKHAEQQKPIDEDIIWRVTESVADALAHLHSRFNVMGPIIYRCLRLDNVLFTPEGKYKLCDCYFNGAAIDVASDETEKGSTGSVSGLYRAPEQTNSNVYTTKTDIWCFGCLLLHLCKPEMAINQQANSLNLQQVNLPNYSINITNIINKCLLQSPWDRPSAAELVMHIRHLRQKGIPGTTESATCSSSVSIPLRIGFGRQSSWKTPGNMVQVMPRMGIEVDTPTPLMLAADKGDVDQLAEHMDDVGKADWQGTALIKAARKGHVECVSVLLSELGIQSRRGWTALQDAAYSGQKACIPLLMLEACIQRPDGHTALMGAARNGHQDCVKLLRNKEMRMTTTSGHTALMYAAENNHPQCVKFLLDEAGMQDVTGSTALILAAVEGNVECVALLAIYEAIISNHEGETALQLIEKRLKFSQEPLSRKLRMCVEKLSLTSNHSPAPLCMLSTDS